MKLIIILAVTSCAFAAKLDRTYLPPAGAETAGGSPGSLNAPRGPHSSVSSSGSPFGGANQPSGQISHGSIAPSFGSQNGIQGSNGRGNQGQGPSSGIQGIQSDNRASSNFLNQPSNSFGNAPANFDQYTKPSNQELAVNPDFRQAHTQPERAQAAQDRTAEIIRYDNEIDGDSFAYSFETSNGISAEESGVATNGVQAKGAFSYTGDDGQIYSITYTADENGYQPHGDHLPTPPPIPEEILRSIEENARAAAAGTQEGAYNEDENVSQYDGQRPDASQQQYQPQQSSRLSNNKLSEPNTQNTAAPQRNTQFDATNNVLNNQQDLQRSGADQSFNRPQLNQGSQINSARPSNQFGAPGSIQSAALQGNAQFDNTNSPSNDHQNFYRPSANQITSPQFNQGSRVYNQQSSRPTNQYGVPSAQNSATPQKNSGIALNNHKDLQRPSGQSFNNPQFNQGSQVYQQSSRPSNQNSASAQQPTTSSTDRYNSQNKQAATKDSLSSTQFNPQTGYQYDRPLAKGIDAQLSQSSNFNMQFPSASGQTSTNLHRPQGSVSSFNAPGRHSGTNQPSGFKVSSQNYPETAHQYNAPSKPGQDFSGPRQQPSFSPEEGYKY